MEVKVGHLSLWSADKIMVTADVLKTMNHFSVVGITILIEISV